VGKKFSLLNLWKLRRWLLLPRYDRVLCIEGRLLRPLKLVIRLFDYIDSELDMNDPDTLGFYTELQLILNNPEAAAGVILQFLFSQKCRIVHSLAIKLNLDHSSHDIGQDCFVTTVSHKSTSI
jgi:hypothetical protein